MSSVLSCAAIAYERGTKCEEPKILDKVLALPIAAILSAGLAQTLKGRVSLLLRSCFRISILFLLISFFLLREEPLTLTHVGRTYLLYD